MDIKDLYKMLGIGRASLVEIFESIEDVVFDQSNHLVERSHWSKTK